MTLWPKVIEASEPHEQVLLHLLQLRLTWLSFYALALCVRRILLEQGCSDLQLSGRRTLYARTSCGGFDMRGFSFAAFGRNSCLVQVKPYRRPVSRRFVDELRGAMQREGATEGILATTSTFSRMARTAARQYLARPVRLLDGHDLARVLLDSRIGVSVARRPQSGESDLALDESFFQELERLAKHN